jgi:hypothetical protein
MEAADFGIADEGPLEIKAPAKSECVVPDNFLTPPREKSVIQMRTPLMTCRLGAIFAPACFSQERMFYLRLPVFLSANAETAKLSAPERRARSLPVGTK